MPSTMATDRRSGNAAHRAIEVAERAFSECCQAVRSAGQTVHSKAKPAR